MKSFTLFMRMVVGVALVGAGIYGFIYDLPFWGMPLIFGLLAAGGVVEKAQKETP